MSANDIVTRLQLNFQEIGGIARVFQEEPSQPIELNDLPAVLPITIGKMTRKTPDESPGEYIVERQYIYGLLINTVEQAVVDSGNLGSLVDAQAVLLIDSIEDYFILHPRLHTATPQLGELGGLAHDVFVQDDGLQLRKGPGGGVFRAIAYTFTIAERRTPLYALIS